MIALLWAASAWAQEEACAPYDHTQWAAALDRAEQDMASGAVEPARAELITAHRQVLCLDTIARPSLVARLGRDLALAFFFDQDDDATRRWALSYRYAGELPWDDAQFSPEHPFRDAVETAEDPIEGGPEGAGLLWPKKGGIFANGHLLTAPKAPAEVPLLVQVADKDGLITAAWWQDGAAFPATVVGPAGKPPVAPTWWVPEAAAVAIAEPPQAEPAKPAVAKVEPAVAKVEPAVAPIAPSGTEVAAPSGPIAYVDPFADARRRALAREVSERETVDAAGNRTVVRTEVITFASDPSAGAPVSAKHYAEWLVDYGEWAPGGRMAVTGADAHYLQGWTGGKPPDAAAPVTWVSFAAASAYCGSWGNRVAQVAQVSPDALVWEWRDGGGSPVWKGRDGAVRPADPKVTAADVGFRCAP